MTESPDEINFQAVEFAKNGDYAEAIECFKRGLIMSSENPLLWYNLGITYQKIGLLELAKEALLKAYDFSYGNDESIIEVLGHICLLQNEYDEAMDFFTEGLNLNHLNTRFLNMMGSILFSQGNYEEACHFFELAVTIDSNDYDAIFNLRDTYRQLKNEKGVLECELKLKSLSSPSGSFYA